jgi:hypothetical protein
MAREPSLAAGTHLSPRRAISTDGGVGSLAPQLRQAAGLAQLADDVAGRHHPERRGHDNVTARL